MERKFEVSVDKDSGDVKVKYFYSTSNKHSTTVIKDEEVISEREMMTLFYQYLKLWCKKNNSKDLWCQDGKMLLFRARLLESLNP